ncbi:ATP-binding protein [Pseudoalteromonas fenneropenaei]|uniref:histidine kinase n=1 Tax=Pseudoalteromonas fenneropenaei TaxID=1737459 RepID=A0ABV7CFL5_9GAMM
MIQQALLHHIPVGVLIVNEELELLYVNDYFLDRLMCAEPFSVGANLVEVFSDHASFLQHKIKSVLVLNSPSFSYWEHNPHVFPLRSSRPVTGSEVAMFQNIQFIPFCDEPNCLKRVGIIVQDVTELASYYQEEKRLSNELELEKHELKVLNDKLEAAQNQLLQSEKMAAIGQLAAGIAHEINNPVGFVSSNVQILQGYITNMLAMLSFYQKVIDSTDNHGFQLMQKDMRNKLNLAYIEEDALPLLEESLEGIERVAAIVKNLKSFSHIDNNEWQYANIIEGIENTLKIANNAIKYNASVITEFCSEQVLLYCQPMQLNQVFLNLIVNAAQAITEQGEITITVTENAERVVIIVKDTGHGIKPEHLTKIFNPFFTTKPVGKGTGLGLSLSFSIISKHKGTIQVESSLGVGTIFTIVLPKLSADDFLPSD